MYYVFYCKSTVNRTTTAQTKILVLIIIIITNSKFIHFYFKVKSVSKNKKNLFLKQQVYILA
jgi:hypothetical protein